MILDIKNLHLAFDTPHGLTRVVNGVSFEVNEGEIFGLVGESGCGKSVTSLAIMRLIPKPGRIVEGSIHFQGQNLLQLSEREMAQLRGGKIAMIFQDPFTSLNPVFRIGHQLRDVVNRHLSLSKQGAIEHILQTLESVGLPDVQRVYESYPHELSGGQQQRVMIAMALLSEPRLLIADEPTTALDVTIQAQILRLLRELCDERGISVVLITHDLGVVSEICDRVAVLYAGEVVEQAPTHVLLSDPKHPYTQGLIAAIPRPEHKGQSLQAIPGTVPADPGSIAGCVFAERCPHVFERCTVEKPERYPINALHESACFLVEEGISNG